jgi:hypothetical protein
MPASPLGPMIQEHRLRRSVRRVQRGLAIVGFSGAAVALAVGVARWYFAYSTYGPAVVWRWSMPAFGLSLAFLTLGSVGLVLLWRTPPVRVCVHQGGLLVQRLGRTAAIPWTQIHQVHTAAYRDPLPWPSKRHLSRLTLGLGPQEGRPNDGIPRIRFTGALAGLDSLAQAVKTAVYPALLSEYTLAFNEHRPLAFGPIALHMQGLRHGDRLIDWRELQDVRLEGGQLKLLIQSAGQQSTLRLPAHQVPNVEVFLQLLQHVGVAA